MLLALNIEKYIEKIKNIFRTHTKIVVYAKAPQKQNKKRWPR